LVLHFTGGASAASSVVAMRERRVSAHIVVDRNGVIFQCRPFNMTASHAGVSRWRDPTSGKLYDGMNNYGIGIEIANAGASSAALSWARRQPEFAGTMFARHRNGGPVQEWEKFPALQLEAVSELSQVLVHRYNLDDLTGHDCVSPERKVDPGPAFPMEAIRLACGFEGLPAVHYPAKA
jgi:N-acetylmuramoyl-L-alanine amidase